MKIKPIKSIYLPLIVGVFVLTNLFSTTKLQARTASFSGIDKSAFSPSQKNEWLELKKGFSATIKSKSTDQTRFYHLVKEVRNDGKELILQDDSEWYIGFWHRSKVKKWSPGDRLKISYHEGNSNYIKHENIDSGNDAWGEVITVFKSKCPKIKRIPNGASDPYAWSKVVLTNGFVFTSEESQIVGKMDWNINDAIFIFHNDSSTFDLWNLDKPSIIYNCSFVKNEKPNVEITPFDNVLELENKLNKKVLQQTDAVASVTASLLNYSAGLKAPEKPVGVFLFLGPTGVGKTGLAKVLTEELYQTQSKLIRFDMSHFTESHAVSRLIGSPPGYMNHEEGGQLTEAIKNTPQSVVLLDEMEKAHSQIHKFFLPVFDEGFILDNKNDKIECNHAIFIMTSNLCGPEIAAMYRDGFDPDDVLSVIEPNLMEALSPELYNRVEPVLFRPLAKETMRDLVNILIGNLVSHIKKEKDIDLVIDQSVHEYLVENGYHEELGARPLKRLIEKKVIPALSYAIIKEGIPNGSVVNLCYYHENESWVVEWFLQS